MACALTLSSSVLPISHSFPVILASLLFLGPLPLLVLFSGVFYVQIFVPSFNYFRSLFKCHLLKGDSPNHLVKYSHLHTLFAYHDWFLLLALTTQ